MAVNNKKYGKPIFNHNGFKIVPILKENKAKVSFGKRIRDKTQKGYSGEYIVLAGKKVISKPTKNIDKLKQDIINY